MVRGYDDNGNVVDLVKWEKQIRADERAKALKEYHDTLSNKMHDLWRFYKADTENRPKPTFMTAYSMSDLVYDELKGGTEE